MKNIIVILTIFLHLLVSCVSDDLYEEGAGRGKIRVYVGLPEPEIEMVTRSAISDNLESKIDNIYIFLFKADGTIAARQFFTYDQLQGVQEIPDVPNTTGYVDIFTTTGEKSLFAIANIGDNQPIIDITKEALDNISTKQQLIDMMVSFKSGYSTIFRTGGELLMTGSNSSVVVSGALTNTTVTLKRIDAKVEFVINSGTGVIFTPTRWRVVNVPSKAILFENTALVNGVTTSADFFTSQWNTFENPGNRFVYYQQENRKQPRSAISAATQDDAYRLREKMEKSPISPAPPTNPTVTNGQYLYAHPLSSYVEFEGDYEKTETDGKITYGKTHYIVHLGYIGKNANDFDCKRNVNYRYNVTINGIEDIKVEVMNNNERNSGVSGDIIRTKSVIAADSHYTTYIISFPISTAGSFNFYVNTPFEQNGTTDIKWVKFLKNPAGSPNVVQAYTSANMNLMLTVDQLRDQINLPSNNNTSYFNVSNYAFYTVYVDEFYYERDPLTNVLDNSLWKRFVNQPDREMVMSSNKQVSADGDSKYTESVYMIKQRSIRTVYDKDNSVNAWGFEVKDETYGEAYDNEIGTNQGNEDLFNGWYNTCMDLQFVYNPYTASDWSGSSAWRKWAYFVNMTSTVSGVYTLVGSASGKPLLQTRNKGRYTCMARNRDLNGDGDITADEVRWYTPAINQLVSIWIGAGSIIPSERLFDPSIPTTPYPMKHYLSSTGTGGTHRSNPYVIWAEEGSSIGGILGSLPYYGDDRSKYYTRCLRNLGTATPGTLPDRYTSVSNNIISLVGSTNKLSSQAYRSSANYVYVGELPPHNEVQVFNRPAKMIKVAAGDVIGDYTWAATTGSSSPCKSYYENNDMSDRGKWRAPNQRELQLMLTNIVSIVQQLTGTYWSATTCYLDNTRAFALDANAKIMTRRVKGDSYKVRCVRDWDTGF